MGVRIITDSACDLPKNLIEDLKIEVLPIVINIEGEEYFDGVTLQPKEMYEKMRDGVFPKTAQISMSKFIEIFESYAEMGNDCIYIAFSSELSGTYNTSLIVKNNISVEYPDFKLEIIDSKCASLGLGMVVYRAASMAMEGADINEITDFVKNDLEHVEHIFTVDNFECLLNGGRVSRTQAFLGEVLNIKPVLDVENGKLIPIEKVRGRNKVFRRIIEIMKERGTNLQDETLAITHADDIEAVEKLKGMITEEFGIEKFIVNYMGCAIGAHTGIGAISIFFTNSNRKND
jgi:DegV family protein with EDD domain